MLIDHRNALLDVLEAEIKALADSGLARALLLVPRWLPFCCALTWWKGRDKGSLRGLCCEGADPIPEVSNLVT